MTTDVSSVTPVVPAFTGVLASGDRTYHVGLDTVLDIRSHLLAAPLLACDIETAGLGEHRWQMRCITFASTTDAALLDPRDPAQWELARDLLSAARKPLFHNAAFDVPVLVRNGLLGLDDTSRVLCSLVLARQGNPGGRNQLKDCVERHFRVTSSDPWKALPGWSRARWYREGDLGLPAYLRGALDDAIWTARLPEKLLAEVHRLYRNAAHPLTAAEIDRLIDREQTVLHVWLRRFTAGLPADLDAVDDYRDLHAVEVTRGRGLLAVHGIVPTKPETLTTWLGDAGHINPATWKRTPSGALSADKKELEKFDGRIPEVTAWLAVRNATKVQQYLDGIEVAVRGTGLVHPTISVMTATTGRMSISDPPLQQFAPDARPILTSPFAAGLVSVDWTAIEVVLIAALSGQIDILDGLRLPKEQRIDPYMRVACLAGIERKPAKTTLLAQLYGQGVRGLSLRLGLTEDAARELIAAVMGPLPKIRSFMDALKATAQRTGYATTMSGRAIPVGYSESGSVAAYRAVNYTVQGSAYDLLAEVTVELERRGLGDRLFLPIHDELVCDAEAADEVSEVMSTVPDCLARWAGPDVPLLAEPKSCGMTWMKVD